MVTDLVCVVVLLGLGGVGGIVVVSFAFLLLDLQGNLELDFSLGLDVSPKSSTKGTSGIST